MDFCEYTHDAPWAKRIKPKEFGLKLDKHVNMNALIERMEECYDRSVTDTTYDPPNWYSMMADMINCEIDIQMNDINAIINRLGI